MGFGVPLGDWLREPLRDWAETLLDENRLAQSGYFKWTKFVLYGLNIFLVNETGIIIWDILMFEAWRDEVGHQHHGQNFICHHRRLGADISPASSGKSGDCRRA